MYQKMTSLISCNAIYTCTRDDKVQDKSGNPDKALLYFGHEIIVIIALMVLDPFSQIFIIKYA